MLVVKWALILLNPLNLALKMTMVQFEDFQQVTITLHKYINMLDGKFNIHWNKGKKE